MPSRRNRDQDPLVLWLTGGPGCSSELALFVENGPFKINPKTLKVYKNEWSWNNEANLLYVDQPAGTGFSTIDPKQMVKTEEQVREDLYKFMVGFVEEFPEFKGRDFYVTGESYAGHYIPHVTNYIYNQRNPDIPLKGYMIGNGLPNPWVQYEAHAEMALLNRLITFNDYLKLLPQFRQCETMMKYEIKGGREMCDGLYGQIVQEPGSSKGMDLSSINPTSQRFNNYDITKPCIGPLCYNFKFIDDFLNSAAVQADLNLPAGTKWSECNSEVGAAMAESDWRKNAAPMLEDTLNAGLKVWIYHGDLDMICNWVGGEKMIDGVEWYGQNEFAKKSFVNAGYGLKRQWENLRFIKFSNAGHMVPMDQPEQAFRMLKEFLDLEN